MTEAADVACAATQMELTDLFNVDLPTHGFSLHYQHLHTPPLISGPISVLPSKQLHFRIIIRLIGGAGGCVLIRVPSSLIFTDGIPN